MGSSHPFGKYALKNAMRKGAGNLAIKKIHDRTGGVVSTHSVQKLSNANAVRSPAGTGGMVVLRGKYGGRNKGVVAPPARRASSVPSSRAHPNSVASPKASNERRRASSSSLRASSDQNDRRRSAGSTASTVSRRKNFSDDRAPNRRPGREDVKNGRAATHTQNSRKRTHEQVLSRRSLPEKRNHTSTQSNGRKDRREYHHKTGGKNHEPPPKKKRQKSGSDEYSLDGFVVGSDDEYDDPNREPELGSALDQECKGVVDYPLLEKRKSRAEAMKKLREARTRSALDPGEESDDEKNTSVLESQLGEPEEDQYDDFNAGLMGHVKDEENFGYHNDDYHNDSNHDDRDIPEKLPRGAHKQNRDQINKSYKSPVPVTRPSTKDKFKNCTDYNSEGRSSRISTKQKEREEARRNRINNVPKKELPKPLSSSRIPAKKKKNDYVSDTVPRRVPKKHLESNDARSFTSSIPKKDSSKLLSSSAKSHTTSVPRKEPSKFHSSSNRNFSNIPRKEPSKLSVLSRIPSKNKR